MMYNSNTVDRTEPTIPLWHHTDMCNDSMGACICELECAGSYKHPCEPIEDEI